MSVLGKRSAESLGLSNNQQAKRQKQNTNNRIVREYNEIPNNYCCISLHSLIQPTELIPLKIELLHYGNEIMLNVERTTLWSNVFQMFGQNTGKDPRKFEFYCNYMKIDPSLTVSDYIGHFGRLGEIIARLSR